MRSRSIALMAAVATLALAGAVYLVWDSGSRLATLLTPLREPEPAEPPVLVVLVESRAQLERARERIGPGRVLSASRHVFALEGGTIVATDLEAASGPLNALGWADRPLEIITRRGAEPETPPEPRGDAVTELAGRETLTRAEAMRLLDDLD